MTPHQLRLNLSFNQSKKEYEMHDATETIRRERVEQINTNPGEREVLEEQHGQVWDTDAVCKEFEVLGFAAPLVVVRRRSDGKKGSLMFQHHPRYYFNWQEYNNE